MEARKDHITAFLGSLVTLLVLLYAEVPDSRLLGKMKIAVC